jgi:hypothetical protein
MEATIGISLCLYLKVEKMLSFLLSHVFNKIGEQEGRTDSAWK